MSSTSTHDRHRADWAPNLDNMPLSFWERLHKRLLLGIPGTFIALLAAAPLILNGEKLTHLNVEVFTILVLVLCVTLIPLVQIIPAAFFQLFHPLEVIVEKREWAEHGFYREAFIPKGYDLDKLTMIREATILKAKLNRRR